LAPLLLFLLGLSTGLSVSLKIPLLGGGDYERNHIISRGGRGEWSGNTDKLILVRFLLGTGCRLDESVCRAAKYFSARDI